MGQLETEIISIKKTHEPVSLHVETLGGFRVWRAGEEIPAGAWGREKALHLFQFLITNRQRPRHKEQIIDLLWPSVDGGTGDRDFKVALNTVNRVLEPDRPPRAATRFITRSGLTYRLDLTHIWIDAQAFEDRVDQGNQVLPEDEQTAWEGYRQALALYSGEYLPELCYLDWTSAERERLQTLALATMTRLADRLVEANPLESIQLAERALSIDRVWEDAYRSLMRAYLATGNRPMALRTYERCQGVLEEEFGLEPLPETVALYEKIL